MSKSKVLPKSIFRTKIRLLEQCVSIGGAEKQCTGNKLVNSFQDESSSKYLKRMAQVQALFGDVYKIQMREHQLIDNLDWLNETVARLFVHARVYQCPRFHGPDVIKNSHLRDSWSCPGGCGLRKAKHKLKKSKLSSII